MSASGTVISTTTDPFHGAKVAVIWQGCVVTLLRDDRADIPWPGWWDLPGGGREGHETPWDCVCREAAEELALDLTREAPCHSSAHRDAAGRVVWFFVVRPTVLDVAALRLGDEGQAWQMMPLPQFLTHPRVIPQFQTRLQPVI